MYNVLVVVGLVMTVLATGCAELDLTEELDYTSLQGEGEPIEVIEVPVLREVKVEEVKVEEVKVEEVKVEEVKVEEVTVPIFDAQDNVIGTETLPPKEVKKVVDTVVEEVVL